MAERERTMGDRLNGKVAVITGAASGIGAATARAFVEHGARVVVADLQGDLARVVAGEMGDSALAITCDVTDQAQVAAAIQLAVDTWGRLDVMFNNAGIIGAVGPISEIDPAAWMKTIDVLLNSVFYGCKHAANVMVPQGSGSIISTTSVAGVMGGLGPHAYSAAKSAVIGLTKSIASELVQHGVRANAIAPGTIPTPLTAVAIGGTPADIEAVAADQRRRYGIAGDVGDIANAALYLASDESKFVNGHTLVVDAGRTINGGSARLTSTAAAMIEVTRADA